VVKEEGDKTRPLQRSRVAIEKDIANKVLPITSTGEEIVDRA
jgi:hypothetical protein